MSDPAPDHNAAPAPSNALSTSLTDDKTDDATTTLATLRERMRRFVDERDWRQFHSPKNLAMSLAIETAELMEHFQWITTDDSRRSGEDPERLVAIGEELADVLCYVVSLFNELGLDIATTFERKMRKNEAKYPAEAFRGRWRK